MKPPTTIILVRPLPEKPHTPPAINRLRRLLKATLRDFEFRCTAINEINPARDGDVLALLGAGQGDVITIDEARRRLRLPCTTTPPSVASTPITTDESHGNAPPARLNGSEGSTVGKTSRTRQRGGKGAKRESI